METVKIFDKKFAEIVKSEIKSVLLENNETSDQIKEEVSSPTSSSWKPLADESERENQNTLSCSYCRAIFEDVTEQREHYKLDWHRYNLKQSLQSKQPISEADFNEKSAKDDVSSISGSDSENESSLDQYATAQGKIFLQNGQGQVFSIYSCLLYADRNKIADSVGNDFIKSNLEACVANKKWTLLMLGGGHFAGAVFDGDEAILHKTFHCYTVRAGQGGGQSSRDNKSGGSQPKSAGASLRRYNEQALVQHVKSIVDSWKPEMDKSSLIIYRAAGPYNRSVLFGGPTPLLNKNDKRLRSIPFSTRRATFTEIKRVHSLLTQAKIYNSLEAAIDNFTRQRQPEIASNINNNNKRQKNRSPCINRAKSRETVQRPLPITLSDSEDESDDDETLLDLSSDMNNISFTDSLQQYDDSLTDEQRSQNRANRKKPNKRKSKAKKLREAEDKRKNELIDILTRGDLTKLEGIIKSAEKYELIDEVLDDDGNTLLHLAALNEHCDVLKFLLENGANPCVKNNKQLTAYTCNQNRDIREALRQFAKENPDKYNYNKAQIPTNVLTAEELAEKKKAQRKIKREKEKIKKKENEIKRQEELEKERFLRLSDREKRALAAERRILNQSGSVISRCFLCASDISGKVPFEYLSNRFCSVECLKAHRMKTSTVLS